MSERAIVLIGPMGAGKTSIGKRVAKTLQLPFYDSDAAVVRDHGPIEELFSRYGETHFRELERDAVCRGLAGGGVVALGGGAVLDPDTRRDLGSHRVVLLTVGPQTIASRIRGTKRPLLQGDDALERWSAVYEARRPVYEALADVTFDTSSGPLQTIVDRIAQWVLEPRTSRDSPERPIPPTPGVSS